MKGQRRYESRIDMSYVHAPSPHKEYNHYVVQIYNNKNWEKKEFIVVLEKHHKMVTKEFEKKLPRAQDKDEEEQGTGQDRSGWSDGSVLFWVRHEA